MPLQPSLHIDTSATQQRHQGLRGLCLFPVITYGAALSDSQDTVLLYLWVYSYFKAEKHQRYFWRNPPAFHPRVRSHLQAKKKISLWDGVWQYLPTIFKHKKKQFQMLCGWSWLLAQGMVDLSSHLSKDNEDTLEIGGGSHLQLVFQAILISTK